MRYRVLYTTPGNRDPSEDREGEAHPDFCLGACMVHVPNLEGGGPGELWVFGGLNHEHAPLNQLLTFDLETKEWARIDPAGERTPENRESASMVFWDDDGTRKLILYGGMIGDSDLNRERVSDVWALHIGGF